MTISRSHVLSCWLCLLAGLALSCFTGCPTPSVKEPGTGTAENGGEGELPPDDAEAVKTLTAAGHDLKLDEEGRVIGVVLKPTGKDEWVALVAKLPAVERLVATGPDVTDVGLAALKGHPSLRVLDLDQANVGDTGLEALVDSPLEDINLKLTNVRDEGVGHLSKIPTLRRLRLVKTKVFDGALEHAGKMENLEYLDLQDVNTVQQDALKFLLPLKKLKFLRIYGVPFKDAAAETICQMTSLRELSMEQTELSDKGVVHLAKLTELKKLMLFGTFVTDKGLDSLTPLTQLQTLELRGTGAGKTGMNYLKAMPELEVLDLSEANVYSESVPQIAALKKLKELNLWANTDIGDSSLEKLSEVTTLTSLNLDKCDISDAGMDHLAKLTNLEFLHVGSTRVTDEGLSKLHTLKKLKKLIVSFLDQVSDDGVKKIQEAIPALKEGENTVR